MEAYIRARQARKGEGRTQTGAIVGPAPHRRVGERQEEGRRRRGTRGGSEGTG